MGRERAFPNAVLSRMLAALSMLLPAVSGCGGSGGTSETADLTNLLPLEIGEWSRRDSVDIYDRETIFDYINGAGEVYRSYDFSDVAVARYSNPGHSDILIELFDMGNPNDAYGVFSYGRETEEEGIGGGYEHKGDVLCFWQDRYYLCLALDDPTQDSGVDLTGIATAVSEHLPAGSTRPSLVGLLPSSGRVPFSDRFFHLHQSLNYHYYLARENLLNLGPDTDVVIARYRPGSSYLVIVRYETGEDAAGAVASFKAGYMPDAGTEETVMTENGKYVSCRQIGRHAVVVLDAESESATNALLEASVESIAESST